MTDKPDLKALSDEVRQALKVYPLVKGLGLDRKAKQQANGMMILCPWHEERNPDCSVTVGRGGGIRVRCHACGASSDAFGLIAQVRGLGTRGRDFVELVRIGAELAGLSRVVESLGAAPAAAAAPARPAVESLPPVSYPPADELRTLWDTSGPVLCDSEVCAWLESRGIDSERCPGRVIGRELSELDGRRVRGAMGDVITSLVGRASMSTTVLPRWASRGGNSWSRSGHRLILPVFDSGGIWRSVRACRITDALDPESPKRLPPGGFSASGLVLANPPAVAMLREKTTPARVVIVEGEPDWLTWVTRLGEDMPVIGIFNGSWSKQFGDRIPNGCEVALRIHSDAAGQRYTADLASTMRHCRLRLVA